MNIQKEQIDQWTQTYREEWPMLSLSQYIAQRAVEWERERLSKIAGEPVLFIHPDTFAMAQAHVGAWKPGHELSDYIPLHTQDQLLAAIVRAEDAVITSGLSQDVLAENELLRSQLAAEIKMRADCEQGLVDWRVKYTNLESQLADIKRSFSVGEQQNAALKSQLAQCKEDADRYRWIRGNYDGMLALAQAVNFYAPKEFDEVIDRARKEQG